MERTAGRGTRRIVNSKLASIESYYLACRLSVGAKNTITEPRIPARRSPPAWPQSVVFLVMLTMASSRSLEKVSIFYLSTFRVHLQCSNQYVPSFRFDL